MAGRSAVVSRRTLASTRWLTLQQLIWRDPHGKERGWDMVARAGKEEKPAGVPDAVAVLAILRGQSSTDTLLVRQFRPPIDGHTIELPAGLVDKGEDPSAAALRELREETGYVGKVVSTTNSVVLSPGLTNESVSVVTVDVDLADPANQNPKQVLDDGEFVEVLRVPIASLPEALRERERCGDVVFAALWTLAIGLTLAPTLGKL
eukprot:TRINITY_DN2344_c0_g2_i1.p2 TRINITY_DN2344_c0_g2~~TRINITY_DN2344_c0_g2_i1.p2  ORF type:complete len:205 (+),score=82.33 TRINITY_DN2344_c0_g2_i1:154-768(+)